MSTCPVIRVVSTEHSCGFFEINESDFNPEIHTIFEPKKPRKIAENAAAKSVQAAEK